MVNNRNWGPPEFHTILLGGHNDFKKCRHLQKLDEKNKESDFKKIYQIQTVLDFSFAIFLAIFPSGAHTSKVK